MNRVLSKILAIFIFVILGSQAIAQKDLIITQAGEEIRCKILDETPTRFVYAYLGPKNKILRNEIFKNLVSSFKYSYYPTDVLQNDKLIEKTKSGSSNRAEAMVSPKNEAKNSSNIKTTQKDNTKNASKNSDTNSSKGAEAAKSTTEKSKNQNVNSPKSEKELSVKGTENNTIAIKTDEKEVEKLDKQEETKDKKEANQEVSPLADSEPVSEFKNYLKYRIGAKGGLGNIIAPNSDTSPYGLYKEKLLRGWMFGVDAAYFFKDNIGVGATYTNYQASNSSNDLDYPNLFTQEAIKAGQLSNKISHKFIGPTFLFRKNIDYKTFAILTLSPGMHLYTDKGLTNNSAFKFKGQSYGAAATLGLDFLLGNDIFGRDIILSLEGGYNYGEMKTINNGIEKVTLTNPINLNRLDFTIGLRFTRFPMYLR
jgi:hypothetical protein